MAQDDFHIPEPGRDARRGAVRIGVVALVVGALVFGAGTFRVLAARTADAAALREGTGQQQQVFVLWTKPKPSGSDGSAQVQLPGSLVAIQDVPLFARSSGYVRKWSHDIGSRVRKGEVLAEIETPEIDRQIEQARANVRQIAAAVELARSSLARWENLRKDELVTQQEVDERRTTLTQQLATQAAAQAEVGRLESLHGFDTVVAPFNGVVTRRNIDVGRLVNAGSVTADQALFEVASTERLKLVLGVPQAYAAQVHPGLPVEVTLAEQPGVKVQGKVARTASAIDPATRTLQTEIDVPGNTAASLLPGAYVVGHLPLQAGRLLAVPANALLFRPEGARVAAVDDQNHIHLLPVQLGRDLGKTVEIASGVRADDRIVLNPPDALSDGDVVQAKQAPAPAAMAAPATAGATKK